MRRHKKLYISYLACTECGAIMPIPRCYSRIRPNDHIKTMYCYRCMEERQFIENKSDKYEYAGDEDENNNIREFCDYEENYLLDEEETAYPEEELRKMLS